MSLKGPNPTLNTPNPASNPGLTARKWLVGWLMLRCSIQYSIKCPSAPVHSKVPHKPAGRTRSACSLGVQSDVVNWGTAYRSFVH